MGNRVYVTLEGTEKPKTYYLHWNGGLDTWTSIADVIFENDVLKPERVIEFLDSLDIKSELQNGKCHDWLEENGHYFINLGEKTFRIRKETSQGIVNKLSFHLEADFIDYLKKHISPSFQEETYKVYWEEIHNLGKTFFKKEREERNGIKSKI